MAIDYTNFYKSALPKFEPAGAGLNQADPSDPVVQSGYLTTLMSGIKAGQERRDEARRKAAAQQGLAQNALAANQGGAVAGPTGDWGDPIGDPQFAQKYLTGIKLPNGKSIMVHRNAAQQMQGFLNDLWNSGYKFSDVGSYNKRKVAGSNLWSRHSTGLALDIDPMKNPFNKNAPYALPKNAGQLAAKWGLSWLGPKNGDWMHFGVTAPQWRGMSPN